VADPALTLTLLADGAEVWPRALEVLGDSVSVPDSEESRAIGVVGWTRATREEVAQLEALRERHGGPIVVLLAELPSVRGARAVNALVEGAALASEFRRTLLPTLQAVSAGQCVVPRTVRELLERPPLSPRERQVLDFSNAEIARKLVVTESNVKSHLTSAFSKLGVSSRSAAAELILDHESGLGPGILRISPEE
jgi:DNA-binding NarL/FixJ family response regulator